MLRTMQKRKLLISPKNIKLEKEFQKLVRDRMGGFAKPLYLEGKISHEKRAEIRRRQLNYLEEHRSLVEEEVLRWTNYLESGSEHITGPNKKKKKYIEWIANRTRRLRYIKSKILAQKYIMKQERIPYK